jgi:DNA-binding ferritin-like protein
MVSGMVDKRHDVSEQLSAIAEEIADLALESLRRSIEAGETKSSDEEKRLTRARRAVEKAAYLLRSDRSPPA